MEDNRIFEVYKNVTYNDDDEDNWSNDDLNNDEKDTRGTCYVLLSIVLTICTIILLYLNKILDYHITLKQFGIGIGILAITLFVIYVIYVVIVAIFLK